LPSNLLDGNGNTLKLKTTANLNGKQASIATVRDDPPCFSLQTTLKDQILIDFSCLKNHLVRDFKNVTFMKLVSLTGLSSNLYRSGIFS
jgi:hypothetical protein